MKLCSKCKKRPAVVFISDSTNPSKEPRGLCLSCAQESGIKQVQDILDRMNISKEDIEDMNEQLMSFMGEMTEGEEPESDDGESGENEMFESGGAPVFPFINGIFGGKGEKSDADEKSGKPGEKKEKKKKAKRRYLEMFCTNLTQKARDGKIDAIVGRDEELARMIQILSRRSKNNPCLIGEPGVGKTAVVEGLAQKI